MKKIALGAMALIVIAVAVVLVLAAMQPDSFRIERTTSINAPPDRIFPLISNFRNWTAWSPWEKIDPALKRTYSGEASGTGAVYAWDGNSKVGQGRMEITDASPPSRVAIKLDFARPMEAHNTVEFTLAPQGGPTDVTWVMHGPQPYLGKIMHLFVNLDRLVGRDFETGLANLKAAAER
jgi:uncharacterized protein YndB with AHSA1/START domain